MEITEKVAYLKGLIEGFGIDNTTKEGKVFATILDILDDMAATMAEVEDGFDLLVDQVEMIDEDLEELEDEIYGDEDEDDDDFDEELYEVECPKCGDVICIDEEMLDEGEIDCPGCGETLEFDLDGALDDCDCGCGGHKKADEDKK